MTKSAWSRWIGLAILLGSGPAFAGDIATGEKLFRNCLACHRLQGDDGATIRKGGRAGPNLFEVIGRLAGSAPNYEYSDGLQALHKSGQVWSKESLTAFVVNPNEFLSVQLGPGHTSKMPFALPNGAADIAEYLANVATTRK